MKQEKHIVDSVIEAQTNLEAADALIRSYLPFIKAEVSRFKNRFVDSSDDEVSIGMMAFHEAILSYSQTRGAFLSYAQMIIQSRLIDYDRTQVRHRQHDSLDNPLSGDEDLTLMDTVPSDQYNVDEYMRVKATEEEIHHFTNTLREYGLELEDILESAPKQERTLSMCHEVVRYVNQNQDILAHVEQTKKLPLSMIIKNTDVNRKTVERHRKYVLGMILILTNGFYLMRGHLHKVIQTKGGMHS